MAERPTVVVVVTQLPCGARLQIELILRLSSVPPQPATDLPLVIA